MKSYIIGTICAACASVFGINVTAYAAENETAATAQSADSLNVPVNIIVWSAAALIALILVIFIITRLRRAMHSAAARGISYLISRIFSSSVHTARLNSDNAAQCVPQAPAPAKPERKSSFVTNAIPVDNTELITKTIREVDTDFIAEGFLTWSNDVFMTLQRAWTARDWTPIRPFEKEELFERHKRQLDEYIKHGQINILGDIRINESYLHKYERDSTYEYLTAYMSVDMTDCVVDESSRSVIGGDPKRVLKRKYLLTYMRRRGVKTRENADRTVSRSCPSCGAPVRISSSGRCEYCQSLVTAGDFDWVLTRMELVRAGTVIDNRGVVIM